MKKNEKTKIHYLFEKANSRLEHELDVVTLLKTIRKMKLITGALFSQKNRMLLRF
jgi:hypothetical protein